MLPTVKLGLLALAAVGVRARTQTSGLGPSAYTVPGRFPTTLFSSYYNDPTQTSEQVQPLVTDPVLHTAYSFSLTDPDSVPVNDTSDPHPLPPRVSPSTLIAHAIQQLQALVTPETPNSPFVNNTCAACQAALGVVKFVALAAPEEGPAVVEALCETFKLSSTCSTAYGPYALGPVVTQVLAAANVEGYDGQLICENFFGTCPLPPTSALNLTSWFTKPKPDPLPTPKKPSGKRLKVLHISDFHLDARYATGAEANCTSGLCCREGNIATSSPNQTLIPAPRYGSFIWQVLYAYDSPYALVLSALEAIPALTGTENTGFAWTMYTGDLVAHDQDNQLSHAYVEYVETVMFDLFRRVLNAGPTYVALGNHDSVGVPTSHRAEDAPHSLGGALADQYNWNYDHLANLWAHEHWLPEAAVKLARAHYGAYMVRRHDGLRVITLNTNLWYKFDLVIYDRANWFNYINMTSPDTSGMLRFLTDELQDAEDAGERVWIMGHVLSGWDGSNPLVNPSNLFYQIVDRYSPHVIANVFWGHTHEDELSIYYANNGTVMSADTALAVSWIGPSVTPNANLNSGFRVYEVDSVTFEVLDAHTWYSDVNAFPGLDGQIDDGPTYKYEYNTREAYGKNITSWGENDPLNATWWHLVTESMESDPSLVRTSFALDAAGIVRSSRLYGYMGHLKLGPSMTETNGGITVPAAIPDEKKRRRRFVGFSERREINRRKLDSRNKPRPWVERKLVVGFVICIAGYAWYVYIGRFCVPMIRRRENALGGRAMGVAFLVVFCLLGLMFWWTYFKLILTPPGFAKDFVPKTSAPQGKPSHSHGRSISSASHSRVHVHDIDSDRLDSTEDDIGGTPYADIFPTPSHPPTSIGPSQDAPSQSHSRDLERDGSGRTHATPTSLSTVDLSTHAPSLLKQISSTSSRRESSQQKHRVRRPSENEGLNGEVPNADAALADKITAAHPFDNPKLTPLPSKTITNTNENGIENNVQKANDVLPPPQYSRRPPTHPALLPEYRYCYKDGFIKPMRAHHCRICATCVLLYDHHCPWIGQCVGAHNQKFFVHFVQWCPLWLLWIFATLVAMNAKRDPDPSINIDPQQVVIMALSALFFIFTILVLMAQIRLIILNQSSVESMITSTMKEREGATLKRMVPICSFRKKREIMKQWDVEWGAIYTEGNLWWLGSAKANWEHRMGKNRWAWFLPVGHSEGDGLTFPTNPRFDKEGRWRRRNEWPPELR
ncbi:hypothetical protein EW145_g5843 [Phellinidium pouzarii]|uniref:Calcineurin-like phosphoesterase domain-containing protein n=1 Tax=Phellinidium pouzarii TaxID=167371 RepID=A0A4V3XC07_9AGAM|nr:hypothetical protein EW145_g5843 [Phellinidium pouzarii]